MAEAATEVAVSSLPVKDGPSSAPLPPFARGLPLLGNTLDLLGDVRIFLLEAYRRHGPIFRIKAPGQQLTVLAGPQANLFFQRMGTTYLRSYEIWLAFNRQFGGDRALTNLDGPVHLHLRKLMKPGFARSVLAGRELELASVVRDTLQQWPAGEARNANKVLKVIVTHQLGMMIAGRSPGTYLPALMDFLRINLMVNVVKSLPSAWLKLPHYRKARRGALELARLTLDDHRRAPRKEGVLLHDLLSAVEKGEVQLDEGELIIAALGPFVAGVDTAANAATFLLYVLLTQPELLQAATAEADAYFAAGDQDADRLRTLKYALMETLRLYPVTPLTERIATRTFEFAGYRVDEGTRLLMGTGVSHWLDEFYPEPFRFDPARFQAPRNEHRKPGAYAPYGQGAHICLGAGLAEDLILVTAASLLPQARLAVAPADYTLKVVMSPTLVPDRRFGIRVVERRHP